MGGGARQACGCDGSTLARFSRDSNIFRTITTEGACPMQYLLLHTRGAGAPTRAEPSCHPVGDGTWRP